MEPLKKFYAENIVGFQETFLPESRKPTNQTSSPFLRFELHTPDFANTKVIKSNCINIKSRNFLEGCFHDFSVFPLTMLLLFHTNSLFYSDVHSVVLYWCNCIFSTISKLNNKFCFRSTSQAEKVCILLAKFWGIVHNLSIKWEYF